MRRILAVVALAAFVPSAAAQVTGASVAPRLKPAITVATDLVRVGDLIENAGAGRERAVFRCARPRRYRRRLDQPRAGGVASASRDRGRDERRLGSVGDAREPRRRRQGARGPHRARRWPASMGSATRTACRSSSIVKCGCCTSSRRRQPSCNIARLTLRPRSAPLRRRARAAGQPVARRMPLRFSGSVVEMVAGRRAGAAARARRRHQSRRSSSMRAASGRSRRAERRGQRHRASDRACRPAAVARRSAAAPERTDEAGDRSAQRDGDARLRSARHPAHGSRQGAGNRRRRATSSMSLNIQSKRTVQGTVSRSRARGRAGRTPPAASSHLSTANLDPATQPPRNPE